MLPLPSLNVQKLVVTDTHYLNVLEIMNKRLKLRIKQFNEIKYGNDNETRIIFTTLKPKGTVTTAPKDIE